MSKFEKRPYQEEAIRRIVEEYDKRKGKSFHVALPTGSGKNYVSARAIKELDRKHYDLQILWVAESWELLYQAAKECQKVIPSLKNEIAHYGCNLSKHRELSSEFNESGNTKIIFANIHTLWSKRSKLRRLKKPTLLIVDEFHQGETRGMRNWLVDEWVGNQVSILGLSATPNSNTESKCIFKKTLKSLIPKYLAEPKKEEPFTGTKFEPTTNDPNVDEDGKHDKGYYALVVDDERNQFIADYLYRHRNRLKKMMIFCINREHCDRLYEFLNIPSKDVYYNECENKNALKEFKAKKNSGVLLTVRKTIHGVDIPDLNSVVIARPTKSKKLHRQMVGRGTRTNGGSKSKFWLVEFTDNLIRHGGAYYEDFGDIGRVQSHSNYYPFENLRKLKKDAKRKYTYDQGKRFFNFEYSLDEETPDELRLPFREEQTFGLELELTKGNANIFDIDTISWEEWRREAKRILDNLKGVLGSNIVAKVERDDPYSDKDNNVWNVDYDFSCGWEATSRILINKEGLEELSEAVSSLRVIIDNDLSIDPSANYFRTNARTGAHLNLGYDFKDITHLKKFLHLVRFLEPAISSILPPSRTFHFSGLIHEYDLTEPSYYCRQLRKEINAHWIDKLKSVSEFKRFIEDEIEKSSRKGEAPKFKYWGINFSSFVQNEKNPYFEIRYNASDFELENLFPWISLWMHICYASEHISLSDIPKDIQRKFCGPCSSEDGDIVFLAEKLLGADINLIKVLHKRRNELRRIWTKVKGLEKKMKKNYDIWDERYKTMTTKWGEDFSQVTEIGKTAIQMKKKEKQDRKLKLDPKYGRCLFFEEQDSKYQSKIASIIIRENDLKIGREGLTHKLKNDGNLYICWVSHTSNDIQGAGYKIPHHNIVEKIGKAIENQKFLVQQNKISKFISNFDNHRLIEFGYVTNTTSRSDELNSNHLKKQWTYILKKVLSALLEKKTDYSFNDDGYSFFTVIKKANKRALGLAEKNGFKPIMEFKTPYGDGGYFLVVLLHQSCF